jgi:hypothetical protein
VSTLEALSAKYGVNLSLKELGEVIKMRPESIRNAIGAERFPIPTHRIGKIRIAKAADVARYLDALTSDRG